MTMKFIDDIHGLVTCPEETQTSSKMDQNMKKKVISRNISGYKAIIFICLVFHLLITGFGILINFHK